MSRFNATPGIVTNGLVLNLDAGDPDSYTRSQPPYVEVLVVAGGGGGGTGESNQNGGGGGGGGAGGLIYNSTYQLTSATAITVTVGAGGAGGTNYNVNGSNGSNSVFGSLTAVGGGGGSGEEQNGGLTGGSGGGTGGDLSAGTEGQGTAGQGNPGGGIPNARSGGAGGGAGAPGSNPTDRNGASGGIGRVFSISGTSTYYAGGGGGGGSTNFSGVTPTSGTGGQGGGGNSSGLVGGVPTSATSGTSNTGGGGGADRAGLGIAGSGGSGIVIVRYPGLPAATGGTIAYLNGYTIHTFTTSGTFTPFLWNSTSNNSQFNVNNGTSFIPYVSGGTFDLDGTDDYFSTGSLNLQQSWTLEIWANMDDDTSFGLFGQGTFATNQGLHILYQSGARGMIFGMYANDNDYGNNYRPSPATGVWYHWVFTYNVSTYDKQFYADTVLQTPASSVETIYSGTGQFNIGATFSSATNPANGKIAVSRFYNRVLSQAEITQNYNAQKSRFGL
jgi:hypothetical protein